MRSMAVVLVVLASFLSATAAEPNKDDLIRVVVVTGVDSAHRWQDTAPVIRKVLERDKRFQVRVVDDPSFLASPALADYDVIFLHFQNSKPLAHETECHENLAKLVKQGKGLVVFHFACGALGDWPEFANLAGRVWNQIPTNAHDPRGPFTVKIVQPQHPITRNMPDFQADDELYTCLAGSRPIEVLATARSKRDGKDYPMAFVFEYGKGRVFHTPLGHDGRSIEMPGVAELLRRGCLWVAGKSP